MNCHLGGSWRVPLEMKSCNLFISNIFHVPFSRAYRTRSMISNGVKCAATLSNAVLASLVLSLFTVVFPTLPFRLLCAISIDNDSRISVHGVANASLSIPRLGTPRLLPGEECAVTRGRSRYQSRHVGMPEGAPLDFLDPIRVPVSEELKKVP
jgi:hypothetical protein